MRSITNYLHREGTTVLDDVDARIEAEIEAAGKVADAMGHQLPSDIHIATYQLAVDILTWVTSAKDEVPPVLRAFIKMLDRMRPMLIDELTRVDPEELRKAMTILVARFAATLEEGAATTSQEERSRGIDTLLNSSS